MGLLKSMTAETIDLHEDTSQEGEFDLQGILETAHKSKVRDLFTSRFNDPVWLNWAYSRGRISRDFHRRCQRAINRSRGHRESPKLLGRVGSVDYSALEVVTLAAFSRDPVLIDLLDKGIDMHCYRLAEQMKMPYEEVKKRAKDEHHPEHARFKKLRTAIKVKAFQYQYGASAQGIAFSTGCSVKEAQDFIDLERSIFKRVEEWYEHEVYQVVEDSSEFARVQDENGNFTTGRRGWWTSPAGTRYEFVTSAETRWVDGKKKKVQCFNTRQMRNYPIQGEASFFVQTISGKLIRWLTSLQRDDFLIINTTHDDIAFDCTVEAGYELIPQMTELMSSVPETMKQYGYDLCVPFPVEAEWGFSLGGKSAFKPLD